MEYRRPREIYLKRVHNERGFTLGVLDVFGEAVWTLEDGHREHKVAGETRIPAGRYWLDLRTSGGMAPRYARRFPDFHRGMIWLRHVPEFEFVYIHPGNTAADTLGCILVGLAADPDEERLVSSVAAYRRVYPPIAEAIQERGCWLTVEDSAHE